MAPQGRDPKAAEIQAALERLGLAPHKRRRGGYQANCPVCGKNEFTFEDDGAFGCGAKCNRHAILSALSLDMDTTTLQADNSQLTAALAMARRGLHVHPLHPDSKLPKLTGWPEKATTKEGIIRTWWGNGEKENVGIVPGAAGLVVIDLDQKDGKDGIGEFERLGIEHNFSTNGTLTARTPTGGEHRYFALPPGITLGNTTGVLAPGIDTKSTGGNIVGVGSQIGGVPYTWIDPDAQILPLPPPLLALLLNEHSQQLLPAPTPKKSGLLASADLSLGDGKRAFDRVREALEARGGQLKKTGKGYITTCPAHEDHDPSLSIGNKPGRVVLKCFAGCTPESIVSALGLHLGDLFDMAPPGEALQLITDETPADPKAEKANKQIGTRLSELPPPTATEWLWHRRFPKGRVSGVEGHGETGKGSLMIKVTALLTTGAKLPFDDTKREPSTVLWLSSEDAGDTLNARLTAAGGDPSRVLDLTEGGERTFELPRDAGVLEAAIRQEDAVMLVIDPFLAVLGGRVDANSDQSIRTALNPFVAIAARTGCAIILIRHWTKTLGRMAAQKGGGSVGITNTCRAVWAVLPDPTDPELRLMLRVKSNLSHRPPGVAFRLHGEDGIPDCSFVREEARSADEVLEGKRGDPGGAVKFLRDLLADGKPMDSDEVIAKGQAAGFNRNQLFKSKDAAVVYAKKSGFAGGWTWQRIDDGGCK